MTDVEGGEELGVAMDQVRRGVEAAVRVPPFEVVLRRHHRRRRRRAGGGGLALAVLVAVGVTVGPGLTGGATAPATHQVSVSVAPVTGAGVLTVADVSFDTSATGALLGRRCAATCHDVTLATSDGGRHYGPEVAVPGRHRYLAAVGGGVLVAYGPDLQVSADDGATWASLAAPDPVADVSDAGGRLLVLLTPAAGHAQLWSGPATAPWSAFRQLGDGVPGSDATARLARPADGAVIVVSAGSRPTVTTGVLQGGRAVAWQTRPVSVCAAGSRPSLSAVSGSTWWVACRGQSDSGGGQSVAITQDGGGTYTDVSPPAAVSRSSDQEVTATSADAAYLSGGAGLVLTRDGGHTWSTVLAQPALGVPHVPAGTGGADVWVVAPGSATVYRSTGGEFSGLRLR